MDAPSRTFDWVLVCYPHTWNRCLLVLCRLGFQSSAEVYRGAMAVHKDSEPQEVAIKKLSPQALQGLKNFQREASDTCMGDGECTKQTM